MTLMLITNDIKKGKQFKERPPLAHSTKVQGSGQNHKIVIQRRQKEKVEPVNLKISKCTDSGKGGVFSKIPVLQSSQQPCGKSGKNPRIISAEVREMKKPFWHY